MPFGAQIVQDNRVRFRLWAPGVSTVDLSLETGDRKQLLPMHAVSGGWFELETGSAFPGDLYRYLINENLAVPDPASRYNPFDVHGPSQIIDPHRFTWTDSEWRGRPWAEAVIYELHVGTFTPEGTFKAAAERLNYLADLGITAVELMPVADFPGSRNWGYDGVLPFAPDSSYGSPDDLKALIDACHKSGLMIFLDVVYNHFGPEGNYLYSYAPEFFTSRHKTPWGNAINFDGPESRSVRDFFICNALYWLEEFHFDGLRLDAVHAIVDESNPHILDELARTVRQGPGRDRFCHLILENPKNDAHFLNSGTSEDNAGYTAQWNDDWHHSVHVLATGERDGYYSDYADKPLRHLGRCLSEGFAYQGEISAFHGHASRGEPSSGLPITSFVNFLQNHDQIGNRALGERIGRLVKPEMLSILTSLLLLSPSPPMLFMGEEFASERPFLYFCDFEPALAAAVSRGRREEFAGFQQFADSKLLSIPDPSDESSFWKSKLDWDRLSGHEPNRSLLQYRELLDIRKKRIVPLLKQNPHWHGELEFIGERGLRLNWSIGHGSHVWLYANFGPHALEYELPHSGTVLYSVGGFLAPWSLALIISEESATAPA